MGELYLIKNECTKYRAVIAPYEDGSGGEIEIAVELYENGLGSFQIEQVGMSDVKNLDALVSALASLILKIDALKPNEGDAP